MKQLICICICIIFLTIINVSYSQMKFVQVPENVKKTVTAIIEDFKNRPVDYNLDLINTASYNRKGFQDSALFLFKKYEDSIMPQYYADNWKLLNKEIFNDSSYAQNSYIYGIHKKIIFADSMTMFSGSAYQHQASEKFKLSPEEIDLGKGELNSYIVAYRKDIGSHYIPLLLIFFNKSGKIVAISFFLNFN